MEHAIPIISLVIALLAVLVGPFVQWHVTKRQIESSLSASNRQIEASLLASNRQIVAPMRQAWINSLRDTVAELLSRSLHDKVAGFEDREDQEYQDLTLLKYKMQLMLNLAEKDHIDMYRTISELLDLLEVPGHDAVFAESHEQAVTLAAAILKREWNRVKDPESR